MNKENANNDEFYIGYEPKSTRVYAKAMVFSVCIIATILIIAGMVNGALQNQFNPGYFEFGELTQLEGVLYKSPVTRLVISKPGTSPQSIILVGSGKMGALGTIEAMENKLGDIIDGREVVIQGTLIYGEGKVLMELTAHENSLISALDEWETSKSPQVFGPIKAVGEIVDPKCYFGVMKPGNGKTHRACAIRCVSGGIPPVLRVKQNTGPPKFYILRGNNGQRINKQLLDYIADNVKLEGAHSIVDDWDFIDVNVNAEGSLQISRLQ